MRERIRTTTWHARRYQPVSRGGQDVSGVVAVSLKRRKKMTCSSDGWVPLVSV
jgi:hypothetical protein